MSTEQTIVTAMTVKEHSKRLNTLVKQFLASEKTQKSAEEKSRIEAVGQKRLEEERARLELEKQKAEEAKKQRELTQALLEEKRKLTISDDAQWVQVATPTSKEIAIESASSILDNARDDKKNIMNSDNTLLLTWHRIQLTVSAASATASTLASSMAASTTAAVSKGFSLTGNFMNNLS